MACKVKIVPVRVRSWNRELACDATRVVGYRAVCSEGYRGSVRGNVQEARHDARGHPCRLEPGSDGETA